MSDTSATDSAVVAAVITAGVAVIVAVLGHVMSGRREMKARRRAMYAEAYSWYAAYKEYPYVVRRRRLSQPEEERLRISEEMKEIQKKLSFYDVWILSESRYVSKHYSALLGALRKLAGPAIKEAWLTPPVAADGDMNVCGVDLSGLGAYEADYLEAVRLHLAPGPTWMHRGWHYLTVWRQARRTSKSEGS